MNNSDLTLDLWFLRHGQTDWNKQGRIQGQRESDLDEVGREQAKALGARLAGTKFDAIYSSDLKRTTQTAELVFPDAELLFEPRLREIAGGVLEGKTAAEMSAEERSLIERLDGRHMHVRPRGGESYLDVQVRLESWLAELPRSGRYACVTHEAVVYTLLAMFLGFVEQVEVGPQVELRNTSITQVRFTAGKPTIVRVNDSSHLQTRVLEARL